MGTILIVEDKPAERRLLYHALKGAHHVLEAEDRGSALDLLARETVDLVLLDLHLPPRPDGPAEGLSLQRYLRQAAPELPVIVTTGDGRREVERQVREAGAAGFLRKPVDPLALRALIERCLR